MSTQNCRVGRSVGKDGNTYVIKEKKNCSDSPCFPYGVLGSAIEGCDECKKTF
jgi:hypothetical protein